MSTEKKIDLAGPCWTLFLVFLVLRITGQVQWSWWVVFSPIWIAAVVILLLAFISEFFKP